MLTAAEKHPGRRQSEHGSEQHTPYHPLGRKQERRIMAVLQRDYEYFPCPDEELKNPRNNKGHAICGTLRKPLIICAARSSIAYSFFADFACTRRGAHCLPA